MSRTFDDKWRDFSGRYGTRSCPFCKEQKLDFSEPRRATIGESDVVAVACLECGHIEFFDVARWRWRRTKSIRTIAKKDGDRLTALTACQGP